MRAALEHLAQSCGIGLSYHDIWGQQREASDATLVSLLAAMHIDAGTLAQAKAALAARIGTQARAWLMPDHVCPCHQPDVRVPVLHPMGHLNGRSLEWRLQAESGTAYRGAAQFELGDGSVPVCLVLPQALPAGYHLLSLWEGDAALGECLLIATPGRCYEPPALADDGRVWGASVQLYSLRSARNWGIGDFTDLATVVEQWGRLGAGVVGVSPLHAMFLHQPLHRSPYSPSNRLFLNVLFLDVEAIDDYAHCTPAREHVASPAFQARLVALRATDEVDYAGVSAAKLEVLALLYAHFRAHHQDTEDARGQSFDAFCRSRGEALQHHATFDALATHFLAQDASLWGWPAWPEAYRDPRGPAVAAFVAEHPDRVAFYKYLQWQADLQLGKVGWRCMAAGLGVGLYADLAVSADRSGSEVWAAQELYAGGASVGCPPDDFSLAGQDWGLPPLVPTQLQAQRYAPFIALLRATMAHTGALRIDHVMALMRLFWIPAGRTPMDGAYVLYPFATLLAIVALESQRHGCLVVGEDLGTVPPEVRERLAAAGVLSYRLFYFERDGDDFRTPSAYARQALVAGSTHDLPTLAGWWQGKDLEWRDQLGLFLDPALRTAQVEARGPDRARLLHALAREGLLPEGVGTDPAALPVLPDAVVRAVHTYLARTPSKLLVVQPEDVFGVVEQANLPSTVDQHPNWRRRLPVPLEDWPGDARLRDTAAALVAARGRAAHEGR